MSWLLLAALAAPPEITGLDAEGDTVHLTGLAVHGEGLEDAVLGLEGAQTSDPLEVLERGEAFVRVALPAGAFEVGRQMLVVANQAASVTLELPEIDGDFLVSRLNQATGLLPIVVLPMGTTPDTLARGNHNHAFQYAAAVHTHADLAASAHSHASYLTNGIEVVAINSEAFRAEANGFGYGDRFAYPTDEMQHIGRAGVHVPDGMTLSDVTCSWADNWGEPMTLNITLYRVLQTATSGGDVAFSTSLVTPDAVSAGVVALTLTANGAVSGQPIDNAQYRYYLEVSIDSNPGIVFSDQRFYGCKVSYAVP